MECKEAWLWAPLAQVGARVGRLDPILDHVRHRRLDDLARGAPSPRPPNPGTSSGSHTPRQGRRHGFSPTFSPVFDFGAVDQFRMDLGRGDMALGSGSEQRLGQDRQIRG